MSLIIKMFNNMNITSQFLKPEVMSVINVRHARGPPTPRKRYPFWYTRQNRVMVNDHISKQNKDFISEMIEEKYGRTPVLNELGDIKSKSPLKEEPIEPSEQQSWTGESRRPGLIGKKIGVYPMWLKNGKRIATTLLQIIDNQVIKYIAPEDHEPRNVRQPIIRRKLGCMIIGAESADPQMFTKEYCGLFAKSGVMPKKCIMRFMVSPDAALQPGTPLFASHYKPGDLVDVRSKTIDRGFQGVMKRWGFHGQPATHGQTKTHRRPGYIGSGGERGVIKGTKMPGHMGNRYRVMRALKILRINTKYNIIWVLGQSIPGGTNDFVHIYDTINPKKRKQNPYFPTYIPNRDEPLAEELYIDELHMFDQPTIQYAEESK